MIWDHITVNVTLDTLERMFHHLVLVSTYIVYIHMHSHSILSAQMYHLDINECAGDHGCDHLCNNTDGSFHCYCNPGYMLDSNGTTCTG